MLTYECQCGGPLFFENSFCTACGLPVGWCEACRQMVSLQIEGERLVCGNLKCRTELVKCRNYSKHEACNRCIPAEFVDEAGLCRSCRLTEVIPDLTIDGNLDKWRRLEEAKRRLLFQLDQLGLVYDEAGGAETTLRFLFKADTAEEHVQTGHADGVVTINLAEADPVSREQVRQQFHEPHRTLIGHFRHEVGHYFYMTMIAGKRGDEFAGTFGDPDQPPYGEALQSYHASGPPADWSSRFISAYASAHPWEDFAETLAFYFDMRSVLETADQFFPETVLPRRRKTLDALLNSYRRLGVMLNELNRAMGLIDLVPEVVAEAVEPKLQFCHVLVAAGPPKVVPNAQQSAP
jgi:hypothetical protein